MSDRDATAGAEDEYTCAICGEPCGESSEYCADCESDAFGDDPLAPEEFGAKWDDPLP